MFLLFDDAETCFFCKNIERNVCKFCLSIWMQGMTMACGRCHRQAEHVMHGTGIGSNEQVGCMDSVDDISTSKSLLGFHERHMS